MKATYKAFIISLLLPLSLQGQEIGLLRLTPDRPDFQGAAAVFGGYEIGGYRPAFAASSQWTAGAEARGVRHGEKTSWTGAFSFEQMTGQNMFSSMFLEPGYFPMDILEFTPGTKSRQTYRLEGGFVTDLGYEWAAGIKASYKAANYAKRKDIRHTTFGMSLQVEPTITYVMDDEIGFASAYIFRARTESIDAEQVGSATDESYYAFLDKGMRYGTYQVWDGDGIHLEEAGVGLFPVREYAHGFSELFHSPEFSFGFEMVWKRGKAGEKGFDWFKFPGRTTTAFVEWTLLSDKADHTFRFSLKRQGDQLRETVLDKVTEGGVTTPVGYGYNAVSDRVGWNLGLSYGVRFQDGILKQARVDLDGNRWSERSYLMYPFHDGTKRFDGIATLLADFSYGPVDLSLCAKGGRGWWQDQGLQSDDPSITENEPFRLTDDWLRKMEYFRAPRGGVGGTLTYHLSSVKGLYVQADGFWMRAFRVTLLPGHNRVSASLKVGYNF